MIAVILPSRGLIFAEVEETIEVIRGMYDIKVLRSHDLPIPDCNNYLVEQALMDRDVDYLWFVEEDTVPPDNALSSMLLANVDVAFMDYGVNGHSCCVRDEQGEFLYCGFGCTLIKREVFELMPKPWFVTGKKFRLNDKKWIDVDGSKEYGGHDIWFFSQLRAMKRFSIKQVSGECKHLKIDALGTPETNKGLHQIGIKPAISNQSVLPHFD